jgi:hypothetical protein
MNNTRFGFMVATAALAVAGSSTAGLAAGVNDTYYGIIQHVSSDNLKVYNPQSHQTLSFLIVPRFGNVFHNGREVQMETLHPGQYVKVVYDQKMLGARHADRIDVMDNKNDIMRAEHS